MGDAVRSPRPGLEPGLGDGAAADFADAVAALVHPQQRGLDLGEALAALRHEGRGLGELEGDGRTFWVVLVVDVRVLPGRVDGADVPAQCREQGQFPVPLLGQEAPEVFEVNHRQ